MDMTNRYNASQMAVAIIIATDRPLVAAVLKYLSKPEIDALLANAKSMTKVDQKDLDAIIGRFEREYVEGVGILNSFDQLTDAVSEGADQAANAAIENESIQTEAAPKSAWDLVLEAEPLEVAEFLSAENPQLAAYILSRLPADRSSGIISLMDRATAMATIARMLDIADLTPQATEFVEAVLTARFSLIKASGAAGSVSGVAAILNELNHEETEAYLREMADAFPADVINNIKSRLFRFEDIPKLDAAARSAVLDLVSVDVLTLALREAPADIVEAALSSIGQRTRRMIENDLRSKTQMRPGDIAKARRQVVAQVMRLVGEGRVEIAATPIAA